MHTPTAASVHVILYIKYRLYDVSLLFQTAFVTHIFNPKALRQKAISKEDRQANEQIKKMIGDKDTSRW